MNTDPNKAENTNADGEMPEEPGYSRRDVAKMAFVAGGLGVVALTGRTLSNLKVTAANQTPTRTGTIRDIAPLESVPTDRKEDVLVRMQDADSTPANPNQPESRIPIHPPDCCHGPVAEEKTCLIWLTGKVSKREGRM